MRTRETSCVELDYTEEDYKNIYKAYEILQDVYTTMIETEHYGWYLENLTLTDKDVYRMLRVLEDMKHYNVLR